MNNTSKLGDIFPPTMRKQFVKNSLKRGLVVKAKIPEENYEKYFVLMGYEPEHKEAYGFFINTPKQVPALSRKNIVVSEFQVRVHQITHTFLEYDSDINCFSYHGMNFSDMVNGLIENPGKICGNLQPETLLEIEEAVERNQTFPPCERNVLIGPLCVPVF